MMPIKPYAAIRKNVYARRESMLRLREILLVAEESRLYGHSGHSAEEVSDRMKAAVREVSNARR